MDTGTDGPAKRGRPAGSLNKTSMDMPLGNGVLFEDNGCQYSPTCLTCPLPQCKYDVYTSPTAAAKLRRKDVANSDACVIPLLWIGLSTKEIAERAGVAVRTVYRVMARHKEPD